VRRHGVSGADVTGRPWCGTGVPVPKCARDIQSLRSVPPPANSHSARSRFRLVRDGTARSATERNRLQRGTALRPPPRIMNIPRLPAVGTPSCGRAAGRCLHSSPAPTRPPRAHRSCGRCRGRSCPGSVVESAPRRGALPAGRPPPAVACAAAPALASFAADRGIVDQDLNRPAAPAQRRAQLLGSLLRPPPLHLRRTLCTLALRVDVLFEACRSCTPASAPTGLHFVPLPPPKAVLAIAVRASRARTGAAHRPAPVRPCRAGRDGRRGTVS
jgi:hypothetical protein